MVSKIDNKLSFESHVSSLCKKASQKLHALTRIANYMDLSKRRTLMKTFVISQFNYCPLVWMFQSRKLNNRINSIHERALRITYKDYKSSFNELLQNDNAVTIHQRNLQALATEIFKIKNDLSPEIMKEVVELKEPSYNLRLKENSFVRGIVRTTNYGLQSIRYLAPKNWKLVPDEIKNCQSLHKFKDLIKSWTTNQCPCHFCTTYIAQVGFI